MSSNNEFLLEMRNIVKTFPGVKAVDDVTLRVRPGTVHALVGENGAGKSTMMKILAGEHRPNEGEIWFNGQKVDIKSTQDAFDVGVSIVYQELNLVNEMTIAENMFLGREPKQKNGLFVDFQFINEQTKKYLQDVGLDGFGPKTKTEQTQCFPAADGGNRQGYSQGIQADRSG